MKKLFVFGLILLFSGCISFEKPLEDYVLLEMQPEEKDAAPPPPKVEKEPVYVTASIAQIEVVSGVQKFLYLRLGSEEKGIKRGLEGIIYANAGKKEEIGKCKIIELFNGFSRAQITDLSYKIEDGAVVSIQVE